MVVIAADNVTFHADPLLGAGNAYFADTEEKAVDIPCNLTLAFTMDSVQFSASEKDSDSLFGACSICLTAFVDNESLLKIPNLFSQLSCRLYSSVDHRAK